MFTITTNNGVSMVNLWSKTYSCQEFDLNNIPYQHAIYACRNKFKDKYENIIYEYSSLSYKVESYLLAYADPIYLVPTEEL